LHCPPVILAATATRFFLDVGHAYRREQSPAIGPKSNAYMR
jgi:hypothetical protein